MSDLVVIGGGIIGWSIAYEAACNELDVVLVDCSAATRSASLAGAGILIPSVADPDLHPLEQLRHLSNDVHERWHISLLNETEIDNGFRKCGGLYIARSAGELASLNGLKVEYADSGVEFEGWDLKRIPESIRDEQFLCGEAPQAMLWVPGESRFCNPDHLEALRKACATKGVNSIEGFRNLEIDRQGERVEGIRVDGELVSADQFCICAGPWTENLVASFSQAKLPMLPVRGQIVLYETDELNFEPIINEGSRYLVPRSRGQIIAGSTIEEAGFENETTEEAIKSLMEFAESLFPALNQETKKDSWAGLRPATYDGFPYMGQLDIENVFVATGHFKAGLQLSTGTAVVMVEQMFGKEPSINLAPFDPLRANDSQVQKGSKINRK